MSRTAAMQDAGRSRFSYHWCARGELGPASDELAPMADGREEEERRRRGRTRVRIPGEEVKGSRDVRRGEREGVEERPNGG